MESFFSSIFAFLTCTAIVLVKTQEENPVIRPINHLGAAIHRRLSAERGNIFFSPTSISAALGMLYYGARGKTAVQMRLVLGFENSNLTDRDLHSAYRSLMETFCDESSDEYHLYVANTALIQKGYSIHLDYVTGLREIYQATAREVDFINENNKVTQEINEWVKNQTHGQINKLLNEGELSSRNVLVLLNAVFFKGTWEIQFDPKQTYEGMFYNNGLATKAVAIPMMHLKEEVLYGEFQGTKILELLYKGGHISMVVLLPESMDGLPHLEQQLTAVTFRDMRRLTQRTEMYVTFPKIKLEFEKNLKSLLLNLGMKIFGRNADFSGISENAPIRVSQVIHKAVIEVDEEGSKASAVTGVIQNRRGGINRDSQFVMNHPFLFAIIDMKSDVVLFQGRVKEF